MSTEIDIQLWRDEHGHYWKEARLGLRLLYGPYPTRDAAKAGAQALHRGTLLFTDVLLSPDITHPIRRAS